jgi:hypothetical protein
MECRLIHIVPFDMGISFSNYEDTKKYSKKDFIRDLEQIVPSYTVDVSNHDYLCSINVSEQIQCRLFDYGIGVFIIKDLKAMHSEKAEKEFKEYAVCKAYYEKKVEQKEILNDSDTEVHPIFLIMNKIWSLKKGGIRSYSSDPVYKHKGLSYVLTIYHILDENINIHEDRNIDLLMNPSIMSEILNEDKWNDIKNRIASYRPIGYKCDEYNESSSVISSWSAVAVIEKRKTQVVDSIIRYETSLQSAWFLFDALSDNLENVKLTDLELQRCKSTATNVYLDTSNILSANMCTNEKNAMKNIYATSGLDAGKEKCFLLLENRISIEKAKMSSRQSVYGIITEILLVAFTLIQIYEPIRNFLTGTLTRDDLVVSIIMLIALSVSSVFIVRKEK